MKKLITKTKYQLKCKYYADDSGHIWSEKMGRFLKEYDDKDGYKKVELSATDKVHRFSVHRLILETFQPVPNMQALQVDHIDGDKANNALSNLKWVTCKENLDNPNTKIHRRVYDQDGTHNASAKFDKNSLMMLISDINSGHYTRNEVCDKYNICNETLRLIINKERYKEELKDTIIIPNFKSDYARDTQGEKNGRAKLNNEKVLEIIKLLKSKKYSMKQIGDMYGVTAASICSIKNKHTWKHLTKNIDFN